VDAVEVGVVSQSKGNGKRHWSDPGLKGGDVDETPIAGQPDKNLFREVMALGGGPAYVRRGRAVEVAYEVLLERCRQQREEWLPMVRLNIGRVFALAGDWDVLQPFLASPGHLTQLQQLHAQLQPRLRLMMEPTTSRRALRSALMELRQSIERFNDRWQAFLATIDLRPLNELRDGYNCYYLVEKEAVLGSSRIARQGFKPLEPLTHADLAEVLPLLALPELAD